METKPTVLKSSAKDFIKMFILSFIGGFLTEALICIAILSELNLNINVKFFTVELPKFCLLSGVFVGVTFTACMWLANYFLERKYNKLRTKISKERCLICDGSAQNKGNGGWLFFTEMGLEFYPHKINFKRKRIIIPLRLIEIVESTSNKLIVKISEDLSYVFRVINNSAWKRYIDEYLSQNRSSDRDEEAYRPLSAVQKNASVGSKYVFISYSSKNQNEAESALKLLRDNGISTWMAPYDIPAGSKYAHVINDAIEKCACVLLMLSQESQASQFVEKEIERAVTYNKTIISMHLDNCTLNSGFRYFLGNEQIVPVREIDPSSPAVIKVLDGVRALINIQN